MVSDFLEKGGSSGPDSWYGSDSDSGLSDLHHLADKISVSICIICKVYLMVDCQTRVLETLSLVKSGPCNACCIRFSLVKVLRLAGYDAALCASRWQGGGKVPGGDHEYVDVVHSSNGGSSERITIDIDFRSHFEIARDVDSYDRILKSLPVVFVGSVTWLKQYLQVMVEASKSSLKQNSMPLPPWRSLAYLQAKWHSPYQRHLILDEKDLRSTNSSDHKQCSENLKRLQYTLQSEIEEERLLKPMNDNWRLKRERQRHSFLRGL